MTFSSSRRHISALCFSLICIFGAPLVPAQAPLQPAIQFDGRVTDSDKAGIAGAVVTLIARDNQSRATVTTKDGGDFRFERIAAGDYLIEVRAAGFAGTVKAVSIKSANERLDIALDVATLSEDVVVTASGTAQSIDEISKAVTVIDARRLELRDEYSILEALRTTPGARVVQQGGPGGFANVRIRGLRSIDTGVLIDGQRFRDAADTQGSANGFINELNVVNLDRVEVLRGSGSSLYGSNAIGGVVNLVTDSGGGRLRGQALIEGGGLGLFRGRGSVAGGALDDRLFYSAGLSHLNVSSGVDGDDRARQTGLQGLLGYHFTPNVTLSGRAYANDAFATLNESPEAAPGFIPPPSGSRVKAIPLDLDEQRRVEARGIPLTSDNYNRGGANFIPNLNDPDNRRESNFFSGALNFTQRLNDSASYQLSYHRADVNRSILDGPRGMASFGEPTFTSILNFAGDIDTFTTRFDLRLGGANLLTTGYEFERESYGNFSTDESPNPTPASLDIAQRSHAFFAQNQTRLLADRLQLSLAFRLQGFDLSIPSFSGGQPRYAGMSFDAPPKAYTGDGSVAYLFRSTNTKLRAHVGNGYRAPSLFERFGASFFGGDFSPLGDPRLKPERSIAVDGGIDQTFLRGRARVSATYFYTRLQNIIDFGSTPPDDPFGRIFGGYLNLGGGLARGVELSAEVSPAISTTLFASYTYTNADQRAPNAAGYLTIPGTSDHLFTLVATQRIGRRIDVTFDLSAVSDYSPSLPFPSFDTLYVFDGYVKADLVGAYTLPIDDRLSLRFYGKVENVFDRAYTESGFRAPGAYFIGGAAFRF
ncbi:MAG TPA: TonB-dependent receptor [Blastocatellia bacterium]|jgi:iron complex outermembrane receptor protein|nr:TonB-dependent receptor [Blastocatellia bacterium]